ncbi:hypothetical protein EDF81_0065 [Enterobacter sp. BIGb0383]|uniref:hypothetical protein n=1 Tax=unclassified Enterobacter TaxID=2608935 RepID=UPI000F4761E1|nr:MULTISPECIES: hypothetical protein [unclassified Enterobacter]ROP61594.1 hypothetical protein EDF81_0065 [Enterobacter sp. BIGb0383]ROS11755.1 hypothetical protein EC848_0065 [Enterobacter sp. BIGb0359]
MYNKIVKALVVLMIVLVIITFTNIIHFQLKGSNMEIGAWSDWVSAACNLVIAGTALYAAYSAKNWIRGQHNATAYTKVNEIMSEYDKITHILIKMFPKATTTLPNDSGFTELRMANEINAYMCIDVISRLESLNRWRVNYAPEVHDKFEELLEFCNTSYYLFAAVITKDYDLIADGQAKLKLAIDKINKNKEFFQKDIQELFSFPK